MPHQPTIGQSSEYTNQCIQWLVYPLPPSTTPFPLYYGDIHSLCCIHHSPTKCLISITRSAQYHIPCHAPHQSNDILGTAASVPICQWGYFSYSTFTNCCQCQSKIHQHINSCHFWQQLNKSSSTPARVLTCWHFLCLFSSPPLPPMQSD